VTPEEAAWVRGAAWRNHHRRTYTDVPAIYNMCACQYGPCGYCATGQHQQYLSDSKNPYGYCPAHGTGVTCPLPTGVQASEQT
jgi:peptide-methionine (S)-S-oxide reductase